MTALANEDLKALIAVTDSNVVVDIFSAHDVLNAFESQHEMTPFMAYRRDRARESLLLAMHLHALKAATYGLPVESVGILVKNAPPERSGLRTTYVQVMNVFVMKKIWPDWRLIADEGWDEEKEPKGNAADRELLRVAKQYNVPMITNEGYGPGGVTETKMRAMAADEGIRVYTPRQFWDGKIDPQHEARTFLRRFRKRCKHVAANHEDPAGMLHTFRQFYIYFLFVLGEEAPDFGSP